MSKTHTADYRVYYEDTDALGIMYHSNYISFCERGRTEMLRDLGIPASETHERLGIGFVIRHIECDYLKMVKLDDLLTVQTNVLTMKNSSFIMRQTIFCQNSPVFKMDITIVCINAAEKPTKAPAGLREKFATYFIESKD
jgi:acyl-CoA thioester hydrolase